MLKQLRIQNFAIIDEVSIEFGKGLNIISGETGAGKSILMDALLLILGGRASSELIRKGSEEATVEALFELDDCPQTNALLEEHGLSQDEELIVRRIVHTNGKNRIFINGNMVNMATLQMITSKLVDLCSQHDQQLLAKPEEQLLWVDRHGSLGDLREKVHSLFLAWKEKKTMLESLTTDASQRSQRIDFLRFQVNEIEEAGLSNEKEDVELEAELKMLDNAESLFGFSQEVEEFLSGSNESDSSSLSRVAVLLQKSKQLSSIDPQLGEAHEALNQIKLQAEELGFFIRSYSQKVSRDEAKLESLNERLALLAKLKRKYGPSLADTLTSLEKMREELDGLENHESTLERVRGELDSLKEQFEQVAAQISTKRKKSADSFSKSVMKELADLNMEKARFQVSFAVSAQPAPYGNDLVKFEIAANPGETLAPLNKIASGGELSRVMLAIHNVISSQGEIGVYLFDEVDAGIGGKTALSVGAKLKKVAGHNQVVCITHLPQVASFARHHYHVSKSVKKKNGEERTVASVIHLSKDERILEIARMLGGDTDKASVASAKAMIERASLVAESDEKIIPKSKAAEKVSKNLQ